MKFWDASAIVPLLMTEATTRAVQTLAANYAAVLVWWATEVECASAIARLERDGALDEAAVREAFQRLTQPATGWHEVDSSDAIRETAVRFLACTPPACRGRAPAGGGVHCGRTATIVAGGRHPRRPAGRRRSEGRVWRD